MRHEGPETLLVPAACGSVARRLPVDVRAVNICPELGEGLETLKLAEACGDVARRHALGGYGVRIVGRVCNVSDDVRCAEHDRREYESWQIVIVKSLSPATDGICLIEI